MTARAWSRASLATRIAVASAVFGLALSVGAIAIGWWSLSLQLEQRSELELHGKRELLLHILSEMPGIQAVAQNTHRFEDLLIGHDDLHLALVDPATGNLVASFSELARQSRLVLDALPDSTAALTWSAANKASLRALRGTGPVADGQPLRYYLSMDRRHDTGLLQGFVNATLLGLPVLLALVALGAWLIARTGLAPLLRFNRLAASIGTESLSQRVSSAGLPRELADLANDFNGMLERIDVGYRRLHEFSGDLAHEMRTPVATLLGRTQVALSQTRTAAQLQEVLEGNVEELERIARLIADMLFIASAEHQSSPPQREAVNLRQEAQRVADYLSLLAEAHGIGVEVTGEATVTADRLLVQRAITNLVSNAVRHAHPQSVVRIAIAGQSPNVRLSVSNHGAGIPEDQLERIFDRFYRIDPARARRDGGAGLGLAIVRSIMTSHGGRVEASSRPGGDTIFTLVFATPAVIGRRHGRL